MVKRFFVVVVVVFLQFHFTLGFGNKQGEQQKTSPLPSWQWYYTPQGRWETSTNIPRTLYNVNYGPLPGTAVEAAKMYLRQHHQLFKMNSSLEDLQTIQVQKSPAGNHVRMNQTYNGIPVYHGDVVISLNNNNVVTFVSNNYKPDLSVEHLTPSLSSERARSILKESVPIRGTIYFQNEAELMIYAEEQPARLVYRVEMVTNEPRGDWEGFVDAITGEVLNVRDIAFYDSPNRRGILRTTTGSGYIWNPDPLTSAGVYYGTTGYSDNNDADSPQLNNQRISVTLKDITANNNTYFLVGPYVNVTDWDFPAVPVVQENDSSAFHYLRSQSGFEDVMVYFFLDSSQRYIQSLGFTNIQNRPIPADPHGVNGDDNSFFSPGVNGLSFGEGGTDDAEDADVILHEYGHAIQWSIVNGWGGDTGGNEEGALGEGFGDYWAGSYSRAVNNTFSRNFVFTWDAGFNGTTGTIWPGRPLNFSQSYPEGGVSSQPVHDAGRYWSAVLMLIYDDIGREVCDKVVLQSHYYLGTFATMRDNASAVIRADRDLFGGSHVNQIAYRFVQRNFLSAASIIHTPLRDTENMSGPYAVTLTITQGYFPIAANGVQVFWGRNGGITDSVYLEETNTNTYSGEIPGNDTPAVYNYYLKVRDSAGYVVTAPRNAPLQLYSFYAGTDTVPPAVSHTPLPDQPKRLWEPPTVTAIAHDNIGIDSVWIEFSRQRGNLTGSFALLPQNDSTFSAPFSLDTSQILVGDSIFYNVYVKDASSRGNISVLPPSGSFAFRISNIKVLIGHQGLSSFPLIFSTVSSLPFDVDTIKWTSVSASDIPKYSLIIVTTGVNPSPIIARRTDLSNRVSGGGKVWIEGGNVGYYFRHDDTRDFDPPFRQQVLHTDTWIADAELSNIVLLQPSHKFFTTPYVITSPIGMTTFTSTADRDAMTMLSGSGVTRLANMSEWSNSAAIIEYKAPGSSTPTSVFTTFALSSLTDTTVARHLITNIVTAFFPPEGTLDVSDKKIPIPVKSTLLQNFPNPFNPKTEISFAIHSPSWVKLKVFNVLGQEMATIVDGKRDAGSYSVEFDATNLSSGVYFYKLEATALNDPASTFAQTRKMVVVK
jgi:predicted small secreted protein